MLRLVKLWENVIEFMMKHDWKMSIREYYMSKISSRLWTMYPWKQWYEHQQLMLKSLKKLGVCEISSQYIMNHPQWLVPTSHFLWVRNTHSKTILLKICICICDFEICISFSEIICDSRTIWSEFILYILILWNIILETEYKNFKKKLKSSCYFWEFKLKLWKLYNN